MPINPPLVISAVNTSTDELSVIGHGLVTGDGFLAVYSPDGGTLPAPLVGGTSYWAIRVSSDVIKLATSSTNAMAGTAINLTSAGSGTLQLLRGLPYRIPRIAVPMSQVMPEDFNATWESLVALWNLLTAQAQSVWSAVKLAVGLTLAANQHVTVSGTGDYKHGDRTLYQGAGVGAVVGTGTFVGGQNSDAIEWVLSASGVVYLQILGLRKGDRLKSIRISGGATNEPTMALFSQTDSTATSVATTTSGGPFTGGQITHTVNSPVAITGPGQIQFYTLKVTGAALGAVLRTLDITYDRP